jgi:hypothetical protein
MTPVTRTPRPKIIITIGAWVIAISIRVGVVAIRIRVISWWRRCNYRGSDDLWEEREPGGAKNDPSRSCAGCQNKTYLAKCLRNSL